MGNKRDIFFFLRACGQFVPFDTFKNKYSYCFSCQNTFFLSYKL
ncbi:hypothetical protein PROPEN_04558 [Proteus penneri ATCC 35198]|nr:hypothetical protein PROPEN_04558 [Proteus penneri ATCC 35198]